MTWRIAIFGTTTCILGLIGGSVLSGEMATVVAAGLMVVLAALFHVSRAFDRREHLKQVEEIEAAESSFIAHTLRTPILSVIHGGRRQ